MGRREVDFKYRDRIIEISLTISTIRRLRGMSQEKLAERAGISRTEVAFIESPVNAFNFTIETLFALADALEVTPTDLLNCKIPFEHSDL